MPSVVGKERREAVETVRAAGLTPVVEEEETEAKRRSACVTRPVPDAAAPN